MNRILLCEGKLCGARSAARYGALGYGAARPDRASAGTVTNIKEIL